MPDQGQAAFTGKERWARTKIHPHTHTDTHVHMWTDREASGSPKALRLSEETAIQSHGAEDGRRLTGCNPAQARPPLCPAWAALALSMPSGF